MYTHHHVFIYSSTDGHLDCCQVWAIVNNTAMNIGVTSANLNVRSFTTFLKQIPISLRVKVRDCRMTSTALYGLPVSPLGPQALGFPTLSPSPAVLASCCSLQALAPTVPPLFTETHRANSLFLCPQAIFSMSIASTILLINLFIQYKLCFYNRPCCLLITV